MIGALQYQAEPSGCRPGQHLGLIPDVEVARGAPLHADAAWKPSPMPCSKFTRLAQGIFMAAGATADAPAKPIEEEDDGGRDDGEEENKEDKKSA